MGVVILVVGAALALLALGGCGNDETACGPEVPAGRLLGHVRAGGLPITATLSAYRVVDGVVSAYGFPTLVDSTGYYTLDLPAGRYVVGLRVPEYYWSAGAFYGTRSGAVSAVPDTVTVDGTRFATTLDFDLAGLAFDLALSQALDGESGEIVLHRRDQAGDDPDGVTATVRGTITDGHLSLRVPGLPPGAYRIEAVLGYRDYLCFCPYDGEHVWLPGTRDPADSPWYELGPASLTTVEAQVAAEPAWLSGRIAGAAATLGDLESISVFIVTADSLRVLGERRLVGGDGSFAIPLHLGGPVKLGVILDGATAWAGGRDFMSATTFDLVPGQTIDDVEIVQSGVLVDVTGPGDYLAAAAFEFHDAASGELVTTAKVRIGSQSEFGLANLWPGLYRLYIRHEHGYIDGSSSSSDDYPAWRPQWFDRAAGPDGGQVVEIAAAGQIVPLHLVLEPGGVISGRLAFPAGVDPTWGYLFATAVDRLATLDQVFVPSTPAPPAFRVTGLADGSYKVGVYVGRGVTSGFGPPPAGTVWYPGTTDWAAAAVIVITDAGTVADLVLPVSPTEGD